jgi:bifunctional non-homologous end joining protein LigD
MAEIIDQADLHFQSGPSDKVYHVRIIKNDDGTFSVPFEYGRRGSTLTTGEKVSGVTAGSARVQFDKIVKEKTGKGYRLMGNAAGAKPSAPAVTTAAKPDAGIDTGIHPQLLNEVAEEDLDALLDDPAWMLQEKMDGHRMMVRVSSNGVTGINRLGRTVRLPETVQEAFTHVLGKAIFDGELVGDVYYAFDLLEDGAVDIRPLPTSQRHQRLVQRCQPLSADVVKVVATYTDARTKRVMLKRIEQRKGEGIVLKRDAPYEPGRPNSGGSQLKFKLYATATVKVAEGREGKRSVAIMGRRGLLGEVGEDVPLGNVTIPPNHAVPTPGQMVDVRYLYAYPLGGSLYQPTYLGPRSDKLEADAIETLKYKAEVAEAA